LEEHENSRSVALSSRKIFEIKKHWQIPMSKPRTKRNKDTEKGTEDKYRANDE
jgi:hypothetical protein